MAFEIGLASLYTDFEFAQNLMARAGYQNVDAMAELVAITSSAGDVSIETAAAYVRMAPAACPVPVPKAGSTRQTEPGEYPGYVFSDTISSFLPPNCAGTGPELAHRGSVCGV